MIIKQQKKIRVMHCISNLDIGGVQQIVLDSMPVFKVLSSTIEHSVCSFRPGRISEKAKDVLKKNEINYYILNKKKQYDRSFNKDFIRLVSGHKPDILHVYNVTPMLWSRLLKQKDWETKIICHCGGVSNVTNFKSRLIEKYLLSKADYFIFVSNATRKIWNHFLDIKLPQKTIYNGINTANYQRLNRSNSDFNDSAFRLITVGRITAQKALHVILYALKIIIDKGYNDIELNIIGDGSDKKRLEDISVRSGICNKINFLGYQENVQSFYEHSHLYICTSYNETFSLTLAEAMYNRLVCISANIGGPSEFIKDNINGYLLAPTNDPPNVIKKKITKIVFNGYYQEIMQPLEVKPELLADKIIQIKNIYKNLSCLRNNARQTIEDKFTMEKYCTELLDFYKECF